MSAVLPPSGWLTAACEAVFVPHRREVHVARVGREQTLCARRAERRDRRRGDGDRLCRLCREAAWVAWHFDTRDAPTRWAVRNREATS